MIEHSRPAALPIQRRAMLGMIATLPLSACARQPRAPGELWVGSSPTGVPFSYVDPATNELTGAMIDIAQIVLRELGMNGDYRAAPFAALIPSLTTGRIDMIAAAMQRTPERAEIVDFSAPVFSYGGGLVVRKEDRGSYPALAAVREMRVGAQVGTRFVDQLLGAGVTRVKTYDGLGEIVRDLANGRIDAGYGDEPILRYQLRVGPKRPVRMASEFTPPVEEDLCLIVAKGSRLLPRLNAAILRLKAAEIRAILQHWELG
ncbi:MAG TPA: transporter substrate-binding domain-containing protein [Sphingopyxis sp.]|jgi:polar amino acid transport system substrate-binding protein|uniref:substrate-binding periplasmic protein n=1 Tax=Sphingopyxis sp. TaxID=1908224 RepID=UPI002E121909|nr:transporter substrate-binding domain-containing protein [Sphingopyxis sp.]